MNNLVSIASTVLCLAAVGLAACSAKAPPMDARVDLGLGADVAGTGDVSSQPESGADASEVRDAAAPPDAVDAAADASGSSDGSALDVDARSDAVADSPSDSTMGDSSADLDARADAAPPTICPPGPPGTNRPAFPSPAAGCGNEAFGRRATLAQQIAKYPTCPSPPVVEVAVAPNCPLANPNDMNPDDTALQACLDKGGVVALPAGRPGFILARGLVITQDGTTLRGADPANPALLVAAATLENTMILGSNRANIVVRFLSLDGNRPARTAFLPRCGGYRLWASGLVVDFARNFALLDNRITNTLCGAALEVDGVDFEIARNVIETNGHGSENRDAPEPWADGITLHNCNNGQVHDNLITDATDVGIVTGGGACDIEHNEIVNVRQHVFGGITLHAFANADVDHTGTVVAYNTVRGQNGMTAFGFSLGIHAWSRYPYITGGTVACNGVSGAVVNIGIDGARSLTVRDNMIGATGGTARCGGAAIGYASNSAHVMSSTLQPGWTERSYDGCIP